MHHPIRCYLRSQEGLSCYNIVELTLIVIPTPEVHTPEAIVACDVDVNAEAVFNLEEIVLEQVVVDLEDLSEYVISYYASEEDLENLVQIALPTAYLTQSTSVIVIVEDTRTGCSSRVDLDLLVSPFPELFPPTPLELCDINNPGDEREYFQLEDAIDEITGGNASLKVTFHRTQKNADDGVNALVSPYLNIENNQTIYIRVENEYGCVVSRGVTLTLVVNPLPAPVVPSVYEVCDSDNDGFAYFDLEPLKEEIIASEPDVAISFHETYTDAVNGVWALEDSYQNIVKGEQVIYARVYFEKPPKNTGCFKIVEVVLKTAVSPIVPLTLDDLYFCTPNQTTGIRVNIKVHEAIIYGEQEREGLAISYHLSKEAANAGTEPIGTPEDYLLKAPTPITIYARLYNINSSCYNVVSFELNLVVGPQLEVPSPFKQCTVLGEPNVGKGVFDLLDKKAEIIGTATGLELYFYEEEADALAGLDTYIQNPTSYTNIENPQVLYVRAIDTQANEGEDSGCVAFTTLTLHIDPNPEPISPDPIEVCHLDLSVDYTFVDLSICEEQILNHESWDLEYYETYRYAVEGERHNAIGLPESYKIILGTGSKTIYVRVTNPVTGCFEIVDLEVILSELPELAAPENIEPMVACYTGTRLAFDLTQKIPEIFGTQNLDGLEVYFFENLIDAIDGQNRIGNPEVYYNTSNPQAIYVGVGNPAIDGCYIGGLTWFDIEVREGTLAHSPLESLKVCSKPGENQDKGTFYLQDLSLRETILGLQDPNFFDVFFYLTEEAAEEGLISEALGEFYDNISNPQVIYARVVNQRTDCYAIAEVSLEVIPLEELILEDLYSLCVDEFGNLQEDAEGNILYPIIHTGLDASAYKFTWYFEGERLVGQTSPSLEAKQIGSYEVEILSLDSGCTITQQIEVVSSSAPFTYGAKVTTPAFSGTYDVIAWAEGLGDYWYALDDNEFQKQGSWKNVSVGTHIVSIMDKNGCGVVEVVVNVIDYPKFFTPNDDGYNDTWNIPGMASLDPNAEIYIFDRHGKLLGKISPSGPGWDGNYNGRPLPSSDYWFVVKYLDEGVSREFKAHFSLKR